MPVLSRTTTSCSMIAIAAAISIDGIQQSCSYQKAYGLLVKVLLVYGSHALTVKSRPGSSLLDNAIEALTALLCPGYASSRAFTDLCMAFNASGIKGCVNTSAACLRIDQENFNVHTMRVAEGKTNAKPLGSNETFVMIPRGEHRHFRDTGMPLFDRRSPMKALIATVQLAFGIIQITAASRTSIHTYGYGSYVFTIIPYAYASLVNGLASMFTPQYSEMQELLFDETQGATLGDVFTKDFEAYGDGDFLSIVHALITLIVYFTVVGASTGFHKRVSTTAQRGWFLSWAIVGAFTGGILYKDNINAKGDLDSWIAIVIITVGIGAPSLGGFVALSQQYLANFSCTS